MSKVILQTQTAPGTPESGLSNLYVDSTTKRLATKDDAGNVVNYGTQNPFILPNDNNAVIIADTDNLSPGNYDVLRMVLTGNYNLTGISGGTDGRILVLTVTSTTNYLTLKNENSNSDAGNRFTIGADFVIHPTRSVILYYDSSSSRWKIASPTLFSDSEGDPAAIGTAADGTSIYAARRDHVHETKIPMDSKYGMEISNNGTDPTNDIDITAGSRRDITDSVNIIGAASTKRLDASWSVGSGNGGLFSGSIANTTYHVFAIMRPDTGVVDYGFDTSVSAANRPASYTYYRRIASIVRTSDAIKPFVQDGDRFMWKTPITDVSANNPGTSAVTRTLTLPTGIRVGAEITVSGLGNPNSNTAGFGGIYISDLALDDVAADVTGASTLSVYVQMTSAAVANIQLGTSITCMTNTSAQIRSRVAVSSSAATLYICTKGWIDPRTT